MPITNDKFREMLDKSFSEVTNNKAMLDEISYRDVMTGKYNYNIAIINPQNLGTIVSYSDYISIPEKIKILLFVAKRYIRGKICR